MLLYGLSGALIYLWLILKVLKRIFNIKVHFGGNIMLCLMSELDNVKGIQMFYVIKGINVDPSELALIKAVRTSEIYHS